MEDKDNTKELIVERLKIIPKEVKDAILAVDYSDKLQEVVKRNRLMIDQAGKLEMETTLVLLGLELLSEYTTNISKGLSIPMSVAIKIANDVNELIFRNIRDALQKMNDTESIEEEKEQDISLSASSQVGVVDMGQPVIPSRESILSEIETPTKHAPSTPSLSNQIQLPSIKTEAPAITNILESKFQGTVSLPKQEVKIEDKSKLPPKNDPYREQII